MEPDAPRPVLLAHELVRTYTAAGNSVPAVDGISLAIDEPGMYAIVGRSGSGKSTLLHLLAGLDHPTAGEVEFRGRTLSSLTDRDLSRLRREHFGFVFQRFHLIPTLTGRANITLPVTLAGGKIDNDRLAGILGSLELEDDVLRRHPDQMSGGQQQRIALARALANHPDVVFADEPTGSLDTESAAATISLLQEIAADHDTRVVIVTHDPNVAAAAKTVFTISDGRLTPTENQARP